MKVLMETITGRKGIKNFARIEDFGDFMDENQRKIKKYKIFEEYESEKEPQRNTNPKIDFTKEEIKHINNELKKLINKCFELSQEVLGVFFNTAKSQEEYTKLLTASGKLGKVIPIIRSCIK